MCIVFFTISKIAEVYVALIFEIAFVFNCTFHSVARIKYEFG